MQAGESSRRRIVSQQGRRTGLSAEAYLHRSTFKLMSAVENYAAIKEFGALDPPKDPASLDAAPVELLERKFIKNGTLIITEASKVFQAVRVGGTATKREIHFAPSATAARAALKLAPSRVATTGAQSSVTHVITSVLGSKWVRRSADGAPSDAVPFSVQALEAKSGAREVSAVNLLMYPMSASASCRLYSLYEFSVL